MATHSSILAWEIPWTEEPGGLQSMGWERDMIEGLSTHVQACARARVCAHTHTHTRMDTCPLDYWGRHYNSTHYFFHLHSLLQPWKYLSLLSLQQKVKKNCLENFSWP